MDILVLGGTQFVGRHIVRSLLDSGHTLTLFSRGKHANPFPECEHVLGDRDGDLSHLAGRHFDWVVDVSAYFPSQIETMVKAISTERYLLISTVSVYDLDVPGPLTEASARWAPLYEATTITSDTYGPLKVACEDVVQKHFGAKALILRPHIVVGSHDYTDRFTSWIRRLSHGGEVVFPGTLSTQLQFVDARDVADFAHLAIEKELCGTYNMVRDPVSWQSVVRGMEALTKRPIQALEMDPQFFEETVNFPMWFPKDHPRNAIVNTQNASAKSVGFAFRELEDTLQFTWTWSLSESTVEKPAGPTPEQERLWIEAWKQRA